ncbi:MAG: hypothetical protein ACRD0O_04445 [Acidimicrobiia bacterium]
MGLADTCLDDDGVRRELLRIMLGASLAELIGWRPPGSVTLGEPLAEIVRRLDAASIPHMVAGETWSGCWRFRASGSTGDTSIGGPVCSGSLMS